MPRQFTILYRTLLFVTMLLFLTNCGGGSSSPSTDTESTVTQDDQPEDEFDRSEYKGLIFYYKNMPTSDYQLPTLTNEDFYQLDPSQQLYVADKLLTSLFFGYPLPELKRMIADGNFINDIQSALTEDRTDIAWLENYILDDTYFYQYNSYYQPQAITILSRFYAMKELDRYFFHNWIAYILTQTIMFSPAYELDSTHTPDISRVYNRIVTMLNTESGMRYMTYVHMMSEENWRRFRSPEDNGREMLEIYLFDTEDSHVPIAAKALQNWKLNTDYDTLEVGLNENQEPLSLFGTTIYNGDDFYRELVKSNDFTIGVTRRLVDFFFPMKDEKSRLRIADTIVSSHPETWQDILLQILFSKTYLLDNQRPKSAEETFFSLAKKISYLHQARTFGTLKSNLEDMHQATMKYKLGKLERVPLDTLSFAYYHRYIRSSVLLKHANPDKVDDFYAWGRSGWSDDFISFDHFDHNSSNDVASLDSFVDYLFESTIAQKATDEEKQLFRDHMIHQKDGKDLFYWQFNMFVTFDDPEKQERKREEYKRNIAYIVLDYISRKDLTYMQREVH